jgi:hypothetical protein
MGGGSVDGTVTSPQGDVTHTFGGIVRAFETFDPGDGDPVLVLDEQPSPDGACGTLSTTGFNLAIVLPSAPAAGTYTIGSSATGVAQQDGNANLAIATSGTVTIDDATSSCVTGSFALEFKGGSLSGDLAVQICP